MKRLAYVDAGFYCATLVFDDDTRIITRSAPIIKWTVGRNIDSVRRWANKKGYKFEFI